jgi:hypothetical protein
MQNQKSRLERRGFFIEPAIVSSQLLVFQYQVLSVVASTLQVAGFFSIL